MQPSDPRSQFVWIEPPTREEPENRQRPRSGEGNKKHAVQSPCRDVIRAVFDRLTEICFHQLERSKYESNEA